MQSLEFDYIHECCCHETTSEYCYIHNDVLNNYFKIFNEQDSLEGIYLIETVKFIFENKKQNNYSDEINKKEDDGDKMRTKNGDYMDEDEDASDQLPKPVEILEIAVISNTKETKTKKPIIDTKKTTEAKKNLINRKRAITEKNSAKIKKSIEAKNNLTTTKRANTEKNSAKINKSTEDKKNIINNKRAKIEKICARIKKNIEVKKNLINRKREIEKYSLKTTEAKDNQTNRKGTKNEKSKVKIKRLTEAKDDAILNKNIHVSFKPTKVAAEESDKAKVTVDINTGTVRRMPRTKLKTKTAEDNCQPEVDRQPNAMYLHFLFPPDEEADVLVRGIKSDHGITDVYITKIPKKE